jgi:hypothetical protein
LSPCSALAEQRSAGTGEDRGLRFADAPGHGASSHSGTAPAPVPVPCHRPRNAKPRQFAQAATGRQCRLLLTFFPDGVTTDAARLARRGRPTSLIRPCAAIGSEQRLRVLQNLIADFVRHLLFDASAAKAEALPIAGLQQTFVARLETRIVSGLT